MARGDINCTCESYDVLSVLNLYYRELCLQIRMVSSVEIFHFLLGKTTESVCHFYYFFVSSLHLFVLAIAY